MVIIVTEVQHQMVEIIVMRFVEITLILIKWTEMLMIAMMIITQEAMVAQVLVQLRMVTIAMVVTQHMLMSAMKSVEMDL